MIAPRATSLGEDISGLGRSIGDLNQAVASSAIHSASTVRRSMGEIRQEALSAVTAALRAQENLNRSHQALIVGRDNRERWSRERRLLDADAEAAKRLSTDAGFDRLHSEMHRALAAARKRREQEITANEKAEGAKRLAADAAFERQKDQIHRQLEAARRRRTEVASRISGASSAAWTGASTFVTTMDGQIQTARQNRAAPERTIGQAVYRAGGNSTESRETFQRITQFAGAQGITTAEIAAALQSAQEDSRVLGTNDPSNNAEGRRGRLESFLSTVELARSTGNDIGEFTRLRGLLANNNIDSSLQHRLLLYTGGALQRGLIQAGDINRGTMPEITSRVTAAMEEARHISDPDESEEHRNQRVQQAGVTGYVTALSELEIARGVPGVSARGARDALTQVSESLGNRSTQETLLRGIHNSLGQESALESTLFETEPSGKQHLRREYTDASSGAASLVKTFADNHLTATDFLNMTGGSIASPANPLLSQRTLVGSLLDLREDGRSGIDRLQGIQDVSHTGLSELDVARGRNIFNHDSTSELNRNQEQHDNDLLQNNTQLRNLSSAITDWKMRHPWLSEGGGTAVSTATNVAGSLVGGFAPALGKALAPSVLSTAARVGTALAPVQTVATGVRAALNAGVGTFAPGLATNVSLGGGAVAAGSTVLAVGATVAAGLLTAGVVGRHINHAMGHNQQSDDPFSSHFYTEFARSVRDAVVDGLSSAPVTVTPQAATHAGGNNSSSNPARH